MHNYMNRQVRGVDVAFTPFNSLFEMPGALSDTTTSMSPGLSILYLRCAPPESGAESKPLHVAFNSLFEMHMLYVT